MKVLGILRNYFKSRHSELLLLYNVLAVLLKGEEKEQKKSN